MISLLIKYTNIIMKIALIILYTCMYMYSYMYMYIYSHVILCIVVV